MKQATTTSTMFKAILAFTILFAAFLAIAIVYNKAYKMKNEIISIAEKYEGFNPTAVRIVNNYLKNNGYRTTGNCGADEYGMRSLDDSRFEVATPGQRYYYCASYTCATRGCSITSEESNGNKIYYNVKIFFKFNLPYLGELFTFDVTGETKGIILYSEMQKL